MCASEREYKFMNKNYVILSDNETAIIRKKIEEELHKTFKSGWSPYWHPYYSEQYTWDGSHDWLIYTSHEATVTFAGEWLVKAIKDEFHIDEIDIISNNKCCSNCGEVTGHFKYMRNIVYECPSCKSLFYLK